MIETLYQWVSYQITQNDVFAGVVGGSAFMSILYLAKSLPNHLWTLFKRFFMIEVTIRNSEDEFRHVNNWLSGLPYTNRSKRLKLTSKSGSEDWALVPGTGDHYFIYKRRLFWVSRDEEDKGTLGSLTVRETITIRMFTKNPKFFREIVNESARKPVQDERIEVYQSNGGWWALASKKIPRPLSSVVLPRSLGQKIKDDMTKFYESPKWYLDRGVPYRRGYLLHGPPGCGKTSLIMALASHFHKPIYTISLGEVDDDGDFASLLREAPELAIILIEDIDSTRASLNRDTKTPDSKTLKGGVTLSGLLNVIDGVGSADNRVLIMTTNFPEKLDPALIRPGRIDVQEEIPPIGKTQGLEMYERFFGPMYAEEKFNMLAKQVKWPIPAAEWQCILIKHHLVS